MLGFSSISQFGISEFASASVPAITFDTAILGLSMRHKIVVQPSHRRITRNYLFDSITTNTNIIIPVRQTRRTIVRELSIKYQTDVIEYQQPIIILKPKPRLYLQQLPIRHRQNFEFGVNFVPLPVRQRIIRQVYYPKKVRVADYLFTVVNNPIITSIKKVR